MALEINEDKSQIIADIRSIVQDVRDLPTLPTVAIEVRRLVDDQTSSISNIVAVVEQDMALTGRILRISNSAYYGIPRKVDNLKMAMVILGVREIVNLVTSVSVMHMFLQQDLKEDFNIKEFWLHCATCAELTVGLYEGMKLVMPSSAYIAGLLHDIGKMLLFQYFPEYHEACVNYASENKVRIVDAEVKLLGIDHGHVGSWLAKRWNIPEDITEAIAQHHIRPPNSPANGLPAIVDWADRLFYLMKSKKADDTVEALKSSTKWNEWFKDKSISTEKMVEILAKRWERSSELIRLLD